MDNNLINIDDLVKQRLGGGEERERPGSWSRMQELLEQEEKKKPIGMIFFRRGLGAVGVLLLLTMLTVGRDEVITVFKGLGTAMTAGNKVNATTVANNEEVAAISQPKGIAAATASNAPVADAEKTVNEGTAANNTATLVKPNAKKSIQPVKAATTAAHVPVSSHSNVSALAGSTTKAGNNSPLLNNATSSADVSDLRITEGEDKASVSNGTSAPKATDIAHSSKNGIAGTKKNTPLHNEIAPNAVKATDKAGAPSTSNSQPVAAKVGSAQKAISGISTDKHNTPVTDARKANVSTAMKPTASASKSNTVKTTNQTDNANDASETAAKSADNGTIGAASITKHHHNKGIGNTTPVAHNSNTTADIHNMPLSSGASGIAGSTKKNNNQSLAPVRSINAGKVAANSTINPTDVDATAPAMKTANSGLAVNAPVNHTNIGGSTDINKAPLAGVAQKKTHEMIVSKKQVRTIETKEKTEGQYPGKLIAHYDTISNEKKTIVEKKIVNDDDEIAANNDAATAITSEPVAKKAKSTSKSTKTVNNNKTAAKGGNSSSASTGTPAISTAAKTGNASGSSANGSVASRVFKMTPISRILPAAAPKPMIVPANVKTSVPKLANLNPAETEGNGLIADNKKGLYFLQSLSAAFNDIKYKFGNAKFSAGLTGGINGTFFGPNSCKGFHFGATANFELDEKWNFMAELKYVHRLNSNYFMHVTYDNYLPDLQNGGYTKDPTEVDYTFSTLHSFEMPLSVRYNAGKLDFFGGANFLYTLGVNVTGSPIRVQGAQVSHVSAIGPNSAPTILVSDFDRGRFGVGYLFGVDYRIAPNMMLDFRNVQTVWDNSKTSSSKVVSNNLFKSPSLQFSLFYTFGSKSDDK